MPARLSHVVILVHDLDHGSAVLTEVARMAPGNPYEITEEQARRLMGWPSGIGSVRVVMHGDPPGAVELLEVPAALRDEVPEGVRFLTFLTRDADAAADQVRGAGHKASDPVPAEGPGGMQIRNVFASVFGTTIELVELPKG